MPGAQVGEFPDLKRRTIRAPVNPLDNCTVISIFPREIDEHKPTIQPGRFIIEAGSYEKPAMLNITPSSWWKNLSEDEPLLEIPVSSTQIAESIVRDYCIGLFACNMADLMPGMFWIPGQVSQSDLKTKHKLLLDNANKKQRSWYATLIRYADSLWSRSNGNPLSVSDDMRLAARELGQNTKEWLQNFQETETIRCVACGQMRNPLYPICPNCKTIIDMDKFNKAGLKVAE